MAVANKARKLIDEFAKGISQDKCRKCGCMKGALEEIRDNLAGSKDRDAQALRKKINAWLGKTEESLYT